MKTVAQLRAGRTDWYRIENATKDDEPTDLYIYDEIGWFGVTAQDLVNDLKGVTGALNVHINSPGGDVFDGLAILNTLRAHKGEVTTIVDGLAASAASFIAQAGTNRVMAKNSKMMIHDAMGMCVGNSTDMREMLDLLDDASDNIASIYAERSGRGSQSEWRAAMTATTWYSPQQALDAGLVDSIEGEAADADDWDLSVFAKGVPPVTMTQVDGSRQVERSTSEPVVPTIELVLPVINLELFKKGLGV